MVLPKFEFPSACTSVSFLNKIIIANLTLRNKYSCDRDHCSLAVQSYVMLVWLKWIIMWFLVNFTNRLGVFYKLLQFIVVNPGKIPTAE